MSRAAKARMADLRVSNGSLLSLNDFKASVALLPLIFVKAAKTASRSATVGPVARTNATRLETESPGPPQRAVRLMADRRTFSLCELRSFTILSKSDRG